MDNVEEGNGKEAVDVSPDKRKRTIAIAAVAVVVIVAVVAFVYFTNPSRGAAAKYGDTYVPETEVTEEIETYRMNYGLTDDSDFKDFLNYYGMTVSQFRERAINEIVTEDLVEKRAKELGVSVTDDEVEARYNEIKGENDTSEGSAWATVLEEAGLTEDILKERYRYNILQDKVLEKDVPVRDATDDEVVAYAQDYLGDSTQVHISHIVISGSDAASRSAECYSKVAAARDAGTLDSTTFAAFAREYSNEANVQSTGGSVGWSGCGLLSDEVIDSLGEMETSDLVANTLLGCFQSASAQDTYEIAFIDSTYTVPSSSSITTVESIGAPDDLLTVIKKAASSVAYSDDCSSYLTKLLEDANVVYYSMPSDASYNISLA